MRRTMVLAFAFIAVSALPLPAQDKVFKAPVTATEAAPGLTGRPLLLNGEPLAAGARIDKDGVYVLSAAPEEGSAPAPPPVLFTVDTTPPRISLRRPAGQPKGALPEVDVEDANIDPKGVEVLLDGKPLDRTKPLAKGKHVLTATARDLAGNTSTVTEALIGDTCQPGSFVQHVRPVRNLSAVFYFPWYHGPSDCAQNDLCRCFGNPKPGNPRPAPGYYDSANQTVVNGQLAQMAANGVDVVAVEWTGGGFEKANYETKVVPGINARSDLQMVILYDVAIRTANACGNACLDANKNIKFDMIFNTFVNDFAGFASNPLYFKHGKYLKFKNKPVVYIYITRALVGTRIQEGFNAIQTSARNNGFAGLYVVADHLFWGSVDYNRLKLMSPGAASSFGPIDPTQGVPQGSSTRPMRQWADKMATLYQNALGPLETIGLVDLTPGLIVQYNDAGLNVAPCKSRDTTMAFNLKDGSDWAYMAQTAGLNRSWVAERVTVRPNCSETYTTNSDYTGIVWTYSFNEWYEGTGLEQLDPRTPAYPYGFGLEPLQILKQKLP